MLVPVGAETLEKCDGYELHWWAGIRGDGTLEMLSAEMQRRTGIEWAPIGEYVIAVALYGPQGYITTILFPHTHAYAMQIRNHAKPWLRTLMEMSQASALPADQRGQLL